MTSNICYILNEFVDVVEYNHEIGVTPYSHCKVT
jgi:hypothetical protein